MYCILLAELREPAKSTTPEATAAALCSQNLFPGVSLETVSKTIENMENWGHRYMNFEKVVGKGICLVLGTQISETMYVLANCRFKHQLTAPDGTSPYQRADRSLKKRWAIFEKLGSTKCKRLSWVCERLSSNPSLWNFRLVQ